MIQVFLSHSSKDKPFVRELADFLEADGLIKVWFDERDISPGENIVGRIAEGLESADFVLLILSPASLSSSWVKEEWTAAFWDQTNQRKTILLGVLYRDCTLPPLLRNKTYFDLRTNQPEGFRAIRAHILAEKPQPPRANHLPVRPPIVVGREPQLAQLRERLSPPGSVVHLAELAGTGKTTLALEFAHRHQRDFESVYWLPCESSNLASIAAELARQLGLQLTGPLPQVLAELKAWCGPKRCLLILDNVESESLGELLPGGVASVLVTTRHTALRFLRGRKPLPVPLFTEAQCFELFRRHIGSAEVDKHHDACRRLFVRLGHLPIAVDIAAALIREDVHFTIAGVAANLPADVTELIRDAIGALDGVSRQLLAAMSACAPEGFFLDLAATIAGLEEQPALDALHQLVSRSLVEELDRTSRRYRLHALVRECGDGTALAQRHAETVRDRFENWETEWRRCEQELPDFELAFRWALENASWVGSLAYSGFSLTERTGRWTEASDICERRRQLAESRNDSDAMQVWLGNQALILRRWGRLDEALALLKKKEAICLELGNKDSLQISYGNQALILQDWGRLDEALALHKKEEAICLDLGNKDGLHACYGNQAVILKAWGRLDEALALHKKEEAICLDLGNKAGLAYSYWSQGLLARARHDSTEEHAKLTAARDLFRELGMPRQLEAVEQELAKTRAADASS